MKEMKDRVQDLVHGRISRREFVERAATGGLGLLTTASALEAAEQAQRNEHQKERREPQPEHGHHAAPPGAADQTNVNPYEEWLKAENVPVYHDYHIANLRTVEVKPWKRLGVRGAYIDLKGGEGVNDGYVCEILPGERTTPQRYLFEEVIYILSGEGESVLWTPDGPKRAVKWQTGSVIAPPLNAWRQHVNRGATPVRFLAITNAPVVIDLFHSTDFVHFNIGSDPARYLAATWGGDGKWFTRALGGGGRTHRLGKTSTRKGGNLIEYEDEDPAIREIFAAELRKSGVKIKMPSGKGGKK